MRRITLLALVGLFLGLTAQTARADWESFWFRAKLDWHRNNAWPEPFVSADRHSVRSTFAPMVATGWQLQNTLSHYHFDQDTQELNQAGQAKLYWILTQSPNGRRTVFVNRARIKDDTDVRVDLVQQEIAKMLPEGSMPELVRTNLAPRGMDASHVYTIHEQWQNSIPAPVLPTGGSGGGLDGGN